MEEEKNKYRIAELRKAVFDKDHELKGISNFLDMGLENIRGSFPDNSEFFVPIEGFIDNLKVELKERHAVLNRKTTLRVFKEIKSETNDWLNESDMKSTFGLSNEEHEAFFDGIAGEFLGWASSSLEIDNKKSVNDKGRMITSFKLDKDVISKITDHSITEFLKETSGSKETAGPKFIPMINVLKDALKSVIFDSATKEMEENLKNYLKNTLEIKIGRKL